MSAARGQEAEMKGLAGVVHGGKACVGFVGLCGAIVDLGHVVRPYMINEGVKSKNSNTKGIITWLRVIDCGYGNSQCVGNPVG